MTENKVVVTMPDGSYASYDLSKATPLGISVPEGSSDWGTGVSVIEVYRTSSGKLLIEEFSKWEFDRGIHFYSPADRTIAKLWRCTRDARLMEFMPEVDL